MKFTSEIQRACLGQNGLNIMSTQHLSKNILSQCVGAQCNILRFGSNICYTANLTDFLLTDRIFFAVVMTRKNI